MSGVIDAIFGGGDPAPDPNPGLIAQATASADAAKEYAAVSRDQLAWSKELAQKQLDVATPIIQQQYDIAQQNQKNANEQWDYYKQTFKPVEEQSVKDAMGYDSAERKAGLQTKAAEDIAASYDANVGSMRRNAMRYGGTGYSPAVAAIESSAGIARARDTALAKNAVVQGIDDKAIALRSGVANFGRNMPNTASTAFSAAVGAGNSAVGNSNSTGATATSMTGSPTQWAGLGVNAGNAAMSGYNADYSGRLSAYNAAQQSNAGMWGGLGSLAGMYAGSSEGSKAITSFLSSKDVKEGGQPVDGEAVLDGLKRIPVESWKYKNGVEDSGRHTGPYAQDVQRELGNAAAPGGERIDLISMNGNLMAGLKALSRKVDRLSRGKVGLSRVSLDGGRTTEPKPTGDDEPIEGEARRVDTQPLLAGLSPIAVDDGAMYPMY